MHKRVTASSVCKAEPDYCCDPQYAVDDDFLTRWQAAPGDTSAWLAVDLGSPTTFDRALISEAFDRVRGFELQYKDGEDWRTFGRGTTIGKKLRLAFEPTTARFIRLNILNATEGPSIWEFQLFGRA
jgi:alpha-L-fucosidase